MTELIQTDAGAHGRERSRSIPVSTLHEIHSLVERRDEKTVALHVGEPHIRMPASASEAFVRAIQDGHTAYTDAPGLLPLREALAARLSGNGAPSPDQVFVTPGSCQAIAAVLQSVAVDGGVALLPMVHWPIHLQQVVLAGLAPRFVPLTGTADQVVAGLEDQWDERVRVLVLNSPANPVGTVLAPEVVAAVHGWAVRRGVWLVSDEAYEDFVYTGSPPATATHDVGLPDPERRVFSVHTFSKGYSMTGCRLGYVSAPNAERARLLRRVQEATLVSPSTPVQYAGLAALEDRSHLARHYSYVRATREAAMRLAGSLVWTAPAGGWYALLDLSPYAGDTMRLCHDLLKRTGVALAPGNGFLPAGDPLGKRLVRLTLCAERETTVEGLRRLLGYLEDSDGG